MTGLYSAWIIRPTHDDKTRMNDDSLQASVAVVNCLFTSVVAPIQIRERLFAVFFVGVLNVGVSKLQEGGGQYSQRGPKLKQRNPKTVPRKSVGA